MNIFLRPPIAPPFIFLQVIPIPDVPIPDSDIVTAAPTLTLVTVVTPAKTAPPFGSRVIASVDPAVSRSLLTLSVSLIYFLII